MLEAGATIESQAFNYTPLNVAAEEGRFELVQLFLAYGANLTGEFYFNHEEALSVSAAKLCECVFGLIEANPQLKMGLSTSEQGTVQQFVMAWQACLNKHAGYGDFESYKQYEPNRNALSGNMRAFADILAQRSSGTEPRILDFTQRPPTAMWLQVSENLKLKYEAALAATEILKHLQRSLGLDPKKKNSFDKAMSYSKIYRLLRQKEFIIKATPDNQISLSDYSEAKHCSSTAFKISVPEQKAATQRLSEEDFKKAPHNEVQVQI